jgi:hypothetical protein
VRVGEPRDDRQIQAPSRRFSQAKQIPTPEDVFRSEVQLSHNNNNNRNNNNNFILILTHEPKGQLQNQQE